MKRISLIAAALAASCGAPAPALAAETITYSYDTRGRLVQVARSGTVNNGVVTTYAHDKADNRTSKSVTGSINAQSTAATEGNDQLFGTDGNDSIDGLGGGDTFWIDQGGNDVVNGGAGNDAFLMGTHLNAADSIDGGAGNDQMAIQGNYPNLVLGAANLVNIETIAPLSSQDNRFGGGSGDTGIFFSYNITSVDQNVPAGTTFTLNSNQLKAQEPLTFDGSAETDGHLRVFSGFGNDRITGGAGNDALFGNLGADRLAGLGGADTFTLRSGESSGAAYDTMVGFDERVDRIDLPFTVSGFASPVSNANLSAATFESDLTAAVGALGANQAMTVTATSGTLAGKTFLVMDANGAPGFQVGVDLILEMEAPPVPIPNSTHFFI